MGKIKYNNPTRLHPLLCAMLAYNEYDANDDPRIVSTTSLMKPTHMLALERFYCESDKEVDIEALIPSVMGNAVHSLLEKSVATTEDDLWIQFGIPKPELFAFEQEKRLIREIDDYIVSGKFDIMFMYNGSEWHLADLKTMSIWAMMIDPDKKKEEFTKQLSIYRWLNEHKVISDTAEILFWYTDWSKQDSIRKAKQGYPPSRVGHMQIQLWSKEDTEKYIRSQLANLNKAITSLSTIGKTGFECSKEELWQTEPQFKYYKNPAKKERATKNFETHQEAHDQYMKDGRVGEIIEVPGQAKRCNYCSMTNICEQYKQLKIRGLIHG